MERGRTSLFDHERAVETVNRWISERPVQVVVLFLILTGVFATGLADIEFEEGTDEFLEDTPEQESLDRVNEEFTPAFDDETETTQLIQRDENVLSRSAVLIKLEAIERIEDDPDLRVDSVDSPAAGIAMILDPGAEDTADQIRAVEGATPAEVRTAARTLLEQSPGIERSLSDDLNEREASASATITVVEHDVPGDDDVLVLQERVDDIVHIGQGDFMVFGAGMFDAEFEAALADSLLIMVPAVSILILLFLIIAYRDPIDLSIGLIALVMAIVWTFGFTGLANLPFNQMMVAIPPILLAIGIDFGIHAVNRYREERVAGLPVAEGMQAAQRQLLVAFFIVTGTTAIGFGSNVVSDLEPIREFGIVAAVGIVFTFLVFGIFMPAVKVWTDQKREGSRIPEFGTRPLGDPDSTLGQVLPVGAYLARRGPVIMLAVILIATAGAGYVATDIQTEFDDEDFLPYEEMPAYIEAVPDPFGPGEYRITGIVNFLSENFVTGDDDEVTIFVEDNLRSDETLESIHRAGEDPPGTFVDEDGQAVSESILDVIEAKASEDEAFAAFVEANDRSGNGVPDRNVDEVYDRLFASEYRDAALEYLNEDRDAMRVIYSVEADAGQEEVTADARTVAGDYRQAATATGTIIVFQTVTEMLFSSAVLSLSIALVVTAAFLMVVYGLLEGRKWLGVANMVPIVVTVAFVAGSMPPLDIPFNAMTATVLSITIGIGVAYSVHITHRFIDEYNRNPDAYDALVTALQGTGGGITGSMVTTVGGVASLMLAVSPMLGEFGVLMSISVFYSWLAAIIVLPPTLLLWDRLVGDTGRWPEVDGA